jgi:hypothetical protein
MSGIVWARYPLVPQSLCLWALAGLHSACVGRRWPSLAFVWPVGAKMGGLNVVGVKMHGWGVEMRGWEPKHVVEGRRVHYREKTQKIKEKTQKKTHLWPKRRQMRRLGPLLLSPRPKTSLCL